MKNYLLIMLLFFAFLGVEAQQYQAGVPVNQMLNSWSITDNNCYPQFAEDISVGPSVFPYVTGLSLAFKITAINAAANSVYTAPGSTIKVGDTLLLPSANGGYQFYFTSGGSASMDIIAYGTPQIANEPYSCSLEDVLATMFPCQRQFIINPFDACTVSVASGVEAFLNEPIVTVLQDPSLGQTTFTVSREIKNACLKVYDAVGKVSKGINFSGTQIILEREIFSTGIYFYKIEAEEKIISRGKFLIR